MHVNEGCHPNVTTSGYKPLELLLIDKPEPTESTITNYDFNGNGCVGFDDFLNLIDITGDGKIDIEDQLKFSTQFGNGC